MAGTKYDQNALAGHHAAGDAQRILAEQNRFSNSSAEGQSSFVRVVILDVISDPNIIDDAKLGYWEHELKVSNIHYAGVAPRNSIIARRIMGTGASASEKTMVLYPFFPPHLAFPAKAGEHVWAIFENPGAKISEIGYWMCKIVGPHFVEDVNYTHADRQFDPSFKPGTASTFEGKDSPKYEFPNGVTQESDGERHTVGSTATLHTEKEPEKAYEKLLTESDASKITKYETVPRYRKRPADVAFEGSNNTLIVLGTDRTGPLADFTDDPEKGKLPKPHPDDSEKDEGTGMIDLVAGRGQTEATRGKKVDNSIKKKELGKSAKELVEKEGDPDFKTDRSRILISQKTKPDKNFKIDKAVAAHASSKEPKVEPIEDGDGEGSIVIKSDKIRLIARHDVVILVSGATDKDADGNVKDPDIKPDDCASIIIRTNGDIIFTPAKEGIIKLGGDDADKAVLCFKEGAANAKGTVAAPPMMSTMGGFLGLGGAHGVFASKIMAK